LKTARTRHLHALTGLRFFAAVHVVLLHYVWEGIPHDERTRMNGWLAGVLSSGYLGVSLFFVLSGFILTYNYLDAEGRMRGDRVRFWAARVARVYPVYLLALLIALPSVGRWIQHTVRTDSAATATAKVAAVVGLNTTLLQAWVPPTVPPWNAPGWSLAVEMFFYALFPLLAPRVARSGGRRPGWVGGSLWLAALAVPAAYCLLARDPYLSPLGARPEDMTLTVLKYFPLLHLPQMLLGVGAGPVFVRRDGFDSGSRRRWGLVADLSVAVYVLGLGATPLLPYPLLHDGLLAPLYALIIFGLAAGDGVVSGALSRPALVLLGEASYALYLLHQPVGARIYKFLQLAGLLDVPHLSAAAGAAVSLAASLLVLRLFEEPARQAIRRWSDVRFARGTQRREPALSRTG
jgi:peptidoglycan/LPS O-acetylase OafA/YrhL